MRASGASDLRKFCHFYILKLLFLSIFCQYKWHACRLTCTDKFPNIPTNTNIEQMYVYASELRKFCHFYILKLLFLSIFCRYSRYFVGTNYMLVGLHVPTNFLIYRQTLKLSKCMCMRASLQNFGIFTFLICYFFQYFVGTSDTLSVQMTCLSAQMYR